HDGQAREHRRPPHPGRHVRQRLVAVVSPFRRRGGFDAESQEPEPGQGQDRLGGAEREEQRQRARGAAEDVPGDEPPLRGPEEELSVKISGSVRVALRKMCLEMIRAFEAPRTIADSTKGSALSRRVSARTTRKYCGMKTTVIENAAAAMPPHALDCPPEIAI